MSKSKNHNNHKERVEKFKQKQHTMSEQKETTQQLPPVREVPVWDSKETFEITGLEYEYINNFIFSVSQAFAACQSIMQRSLLNGKVRMEFDKLVTAEDGTHSYVRMTPEESAPHKAEFAKLVELLKNPPQTKESPLKVVTDEEEQGIAVSEGSVE